MPRVRRPTLADALMSGASVLVLLVALMAMDDRIRSEVWRQVSAPASVEIAGVGDRARAIAHVVAGTVRDQNEMNRTLMIFSVAATVLVVFMLRT